MSKRARGLAAAQRPTDVRDKKIETPDLLSFNFRYLSCDTNPGQSPEQWCELANKTTLLADFVRKLVHLSDQNITVSQSEKSLTLYKGFPGKRVTDFSCPTGLENKNWGTIRNIGGQKARVAGFLEGNIFYPVFLDKNHVFYKADKK